MVDWGIFAHLIGSRALGVDLFFVLSGFALFHIYHPIFEEDYASKKADKFYLLRLGRLYPIHLVTMGIIWLYHSLGIPHPINSGLENALFDNVGATLFTNLTLTNSWGIIPVSSWNEPAWSLSALFIAYLTFPNLVFICRKLKSTPTILALIFGCYVAQTSTYLFMEGASGSDGAGALIRVLTNFFAGCLAYKLCQNKFWATKNGDAIFLALTALFIIGMYVQVLLPHLLHFSVICVLFPFMLIALTHVKSIVPKLLANRVLISLGKISLCLYMLQYPMLMGLSYLLGEQLHTLATTSIIMPYLLLLCSTILLAALAYLFTRFIEIPCYKGIKKRFHIEK